MSGALPAGALPPAPEPSLDILVVDGPVASPSNTISPSSSQAGGDSHNGNDHLHSRAASTIPKDDSSFEKGPFFFAGRTIPNISRFRALFTLASLDTRRAVTTVTDAFHLGRSANAEAWVAQHVGEEITSPCTRCSNGRGQFPGQACVVVDGHFSGSCASCHYGSSAARCSFRNVGSTGELVKVAAGASSASQKGPPTTTRTARAATRARTRATTTLQQLSQAVSRSRKMSPACVRSASPIPREFFPTPAFSLTSRESVKEMYECYLRLARMQGPNSLILSRRRYEVAIAAITQVEVEEAERRERNLREGREE